MRIEHKFEYNANFVEIANEFCDNDSEYQANVLNVIGACFQKWSQDKERTATYVQILEVAEQLDDNGKWFIKTLCDYIEIVR